MVRPITIAACFIRVSASTRFAIDDFTTAIGLSPQQADPFVGRALSYLAINDPKAAAGDLDDAVEVEPGNIQAWMARGLAYERLGDKQKAAGSYAKVMNIDAKNETAKNGFVRVGGEYGKSYQTF